MSYQSWLDAWNAYKDSKQPVWQYISEHGWDAKTWSWLVPSAAMALLILAVVVCLAGGAIHKLRVKRAPVEQHADVALKTKIDNIPGCCGLLCHSSSRFDHDRAPRHRFQSGFIQTGQEPGRSRNMSNKPRAPVTPTCTKGTPQDQRRCCVPDTVYQCNAILNGRFHPKPDPARGQGAHTSSR